MLGFSAFAEVPLSQSSVATAAIGILSSVVSQGFVGTAGYDAKANILFNSTSAIGSVAVEFDAKAATSVVGVLSSMSINDLLDVDAQAKPVIPSATFTTTAGSLNYVALANKVLSSATATFYNDIEYDAQASAGVTSADATFSTNDATLQAQATTTPSAATASFSLAIDYDAKANLTLGSVTSNVQAYDFADVDAQASANLNSTVAYLTIYITDFADEDAQAKAFMLPAVATGSVAIDYDAKANIISSSVFASSSISDFDTEAKANISIVSVPTSFGISTFNDVKGQATASFNSVYATLSENLDDPTAVRFDFTPYADSYDRNRTLYLVSYDENRTVQINPENRIVYIEKTGGSYTVNIAA